jgi:hypothetical protein
MEAGRCHSYEVNVGLGASASNRFPKRRAESESPNSSRVAKALLKSSCATQREASHEAEIALVFPAMARESNLSIRPRNAQYFV